MRNIPYWLAVQAGHTPLATSLPGYAKTAMTEQYCPMAGRQLHLIINSTAAPTDNAIPFLDTSHIRERTDGIQSFVMAVPQWALRIYDGGKWLIFIDEFTSAASQAVHAANLHLLQERRVGNLQLPKDVQFALACNPPEIATNGQELSAAISNRLFHWNWEYDWDDWDSYMTGNTVDFGIPRIAESWASERAYFSGLASAFHRRRPDLREIPTDANGHPTCELEVLQGPYPTPRSWTNAVDLAAVAKASGQPRDVQQMCVTGYIGPAGVEWFDWMESLDLYDPELEIGEAIAALAKGDDVHIHWPGRPDKDIAHVRSLISAVVGDMTNEDRYTKPRWEAVAHLLVDAANYAKDIAVAHARLLLMPKGVVAQPKGTKHPKGFMDLFTSVTSQTL